MMRSASSIAVDPVALSVAPVAKECESKCAPSRTTSLARSVPGISPTILKPLVLSWNWTRTSSSTLTGTLCSSSRTMRL
jgi:hypothetical protein